MSLSDHVSLSSSKYSQLQVSGLQFIRSIGLPQMKSFTLPSFPRRKSSQSLKRVIKSFAESSQDGTVVKTDNEDHDILSRIVTGLEGYVQPPETEKLFRDLTDSQVKKTMEIIKRLSEDDLIWSALTQHRPLKRRRLPRVQLMLSQASGVLPPHLEVTTSDRSMYVERSGGQADIFAAVYKGKKVALKRMRIYSSMTESQIRAAQKHFTLEAILWSQLRHPNVLPFLGLEPQNQGMPLMVLPWLSRGNVMDYMRELSPTPPASQLNAWISDVTSGVSYLHEEEVVHGDLRGRNVLISDDGTALVGDFGLSVFSSDHSNNYGSQRGGHDRCIAPELLDPGKFGMTSIRPTFRSDVYALGCFYYEIYAKRSPFDNMNLMYGQRKIVRGERPDRPSVPDQPAMSDELWMLVQTAWCQQPSRRPTANQVLTDLQDNVLHT